ncbi:MULTISPECIES: ABC transporter substrate-binding protein [Streptomyces]|uniref:Extracellular solute-binding protein n=1 Tax=Streptomyces caniscabiei TaxID=2746961 RepID=A0ABU4N4G5_9ACTN|nr:MULTISPECIES: extracellular solute-binding protein [Streptomyces]MDX2948089.1 extracellular solute-binding protein [Streptomyces caniscabiei]MDX2955173.1 extracellular solute-binding protein [Streptomyces caniscabiei]MDX2990678.1 extracellular solute-binding protein [Streptomyces caniscabiei]MDX3015357.1 extracellular solute-binding protein [Streptomyces caniscabiei]MDX3043399.1 extracellular solute-binding protein [Streptomyces caniscabiei]
MDWNPSMLFNPLPNPNRDRSAQPKRFSRTLIAATVATSVAAAGLTLGAATDSDARTTREESRSLDQLYAAAKAEGGRLVVYAGGDWKDQQDETKDAFEKRFPGVEIEMVVDYSKYHDARVDNQLATDSLVPDVVQLQTLQDFERWKRQGVLLPYRPAGFGKVHNRFKDADGAWIATDVLAFGAAYNKALVGRDAPDSVRDFADPRWKGRIASAYPNDDDATLYLYSRYVKKFGWKWLRDMARNTEFLRGSDSAGNRMAAGEKAIGLGGWVTPDAGNDPEATTVGMLPATGDPFVAWGQREAIMRDARHPAAAKLFLNWQLSKERQTSDGWSVRTDVAPPTGLKRVWQYRDADIDGFPAFMRNRAEAERTRQRMTVYIGEVEGAPTPGRLGTHPGTAKP